MRQLVDADGNLIQSTSYAPFGEVMESAGNGESAFGFTGEQMDQTGLLFLRARYYAPGRGSFLSVDPFAGWAHQPYSLHPYQYGYSNPLLYTDPSGEKVCDPACPGEWTTWWDDSGVAWPELADYAENAERNTRRVEQTVGLGADFTPIAGDIKGFYEVFTGEDSVTGEDLGNWRWLGIIGASELRHLDEVADACRKVANSVVRGADNVLRGGKKRVLVVGESATFEYPANLARAKSEFSVIGTSLPTDEPIGTFPSNLTVRTGIDATKLESLFAGEKFDAIIFNNPHILFRGEKEKTGKATAELIDGFIKSARNVLASNGTIHVNVTETLVKKHEDVREVLGLPTGRFGETDFYAPFLPRYTTGGPFRYYGVGPERVQKLLNFQFK